MYSSGGKFAPHPSSLGAGLDAEPWGFRCHTSGIREKQKKSKFIFHNKKPISLHTCMRHPRPSVHTRYAQGSGKLPQTQSPGFLTGRIRASFG